MDFKRPFIVTAAILLLTILTLFARGDVELALGYVSLAVAVVAFVLQLDQADKSSKLLDTARHGIEMADRSLADRLGQMERLLNSYRGHADALHGALISAVQGTPDGMANTLMSRPLPDPGVAAAAAGNPAPPPAGGVENTTN